MNWTLKKQYTVFYVSVLFKLMYKCLSVLFYTEYLGQVLNVLKCHRTDKIILKKVKTV